MNKLRNYFLSGLIIFLPLALTICIFYWAISSAEGLLGPHLEPIFEERFQFYFPGISVIVLISIIILIGMAAANFFGKQIYTLFERFLVKLPFFRQVYPALKEMAIFLFSRDRLSSFKQVVLVEYPRKGVYAVGFLTNESGRIFSEKTRHELCNVFISSSPSPLTGFTALVPKKDLIFLDISIEHAFKFIVSGGVVNPPE